MIVQEAAKDDLDTNHYIQMHLVQWIHSGCLNGGKYWLFATSLVTSYPIFPIDSTTHPHFGLFNAFKEFVHSDLFNYLFF